MTIEEHVPRFMDLPVHEFEPATGLVNAAGWAYRVQSSRRSSFANAGSLFAWLTKSKQTQQPRVAMSAADAIRHIADLPESGELRALVIGPWSYESEPPIAVLEALTRSATAFRSLRALFIGDITREECEISWLNQCDMGPLLSHFPQLEILHLRGGTELRFSALVHHGLRRLVVETGGLPQAALHDIAAADLPTLEHLELWMGDAMYGADWLITDLESLLASVRLPALKVLALRNSDRSDAIAASIVASPLFARLDELDLSMGTLGDAGGRALLASPQLRRLKRLRLRHHFLSDAAMAELRAVALEIDLDQRQAEEDGMRSCEVAE